MLPAVSIIMPTFNRLEFLPPAIESVFAQTFTQWELIIADDGSGAETRAYLQSLADPRVRVLWLAHSGRPSAVSNAALREARGEYVAFLDSDDLWLPGKLEAQIESLRRHPERGWSYTKFSLVNESGAPIAARTAQWPVASGWILEKLLHESTVIAQPSVVVSRQLLEQLGAFDERLIMCYDDELWLRLAAHSEIDGIDAPLTLVRRHRHHSGSDVIAWRDRRRVFEQALRAHGGGPLHPILHKLRAQMSAGLSKSQAAAGQRAGALGTLLASLPHTAPYPKCWLGALLAVVRAFVPTPVRRLARRALRTSGSTLTSLPREFCSILTRSQRRSVLAAQAISLAMALSTVVGIAAIAPFFAVLGDPRLIERWGALHWLYEHAGFAGPRSFVAALGIAFIGVVLLANLINVLGSLAMNRLALRIGTELQTALFAEYLSRPYRFHAATSSTALFNNVVNEPARVTYGILQHAFTLVTNLVTASFIILSILIVKPALAAAMVVGLAGGYALIYLTVRNRLLRVGQAQSVHATEQAQTVNESLGAIKEIIVLQAQDLFRGRFERASRSFSRAAAHSQFVAQTPRYIMECVAAAGLVGLAMALQGAQGGVGPWLGQLTFLAFAAYRLLPILQQAFAAIVRIRADRAALALIAPDLLSARARGSTSPSDAPAAPAKSGSPWRGRTHWEIELNEISFRYAPDRPWALGGVSLRIPARATVGIVGANGSGKSTLVDVIAGLLVPETGRMEVGALLIDDANRAHWQSRIAYVPQSIYLLDATIAQNIALGVAPHDIDPERLRNAVRLTQLDDFIEALPQGLEHPVGERGIRLSGGQRQRIGIARALYRDATVLLLDEATNALDGLTEQELMQTLQRLRGKYTTVVVAHRMSTVRACDVIFQIENGKLAGSGTYEGLLENSEAFRRMAGLR
jgi:ABC-type multidrug transport system fused ATPase/permease subunit/GT2 family glycosyltransferase